MKFQKPPKIYISKFENGIGKYIKAESNLFNADHLRNFIIDLIIMENLLIRKGRYLLMWFSL